MLRRQAPLMATLVLVLPELLLLMPLHSLLVPLLRPQRLLRMHFLHPAHLLLSLLGGELLLELLLGGQ